MDATEVSITNIRDVEPGVIIVDFDPPAATYEPGAHVEVVLPGDITRQYSLCGGWSIAVKLEPESRGGSAAVHRLAVGDRIKVNCVRNTFPVVKDAPYSILVAGGIGIVPLYSMAKWLKAHGREFDMFYYGHGDNRLANEVGAIHLGNRDEGKAYLNSLDKAPSATHFYVCGPDGLMRQARNHAERYLPPEAIHSESFRADGGDGQSFTVKIQGKNLEVPADKPITGVLSENGVGVLTSCESGTCGTCIMQVVAGDVDHRDLILSETERAAGLFTPCCSRAIGSTLEIRRRPKDFEESVRPQKRGIASRLLRGLTNRSS